MQTILSLVEQYGAWVVFANVLALQLGLPIPAYPTLILVGAVSARGDVGLAQVVAVAVVASLLADLAWYFAGSRLGRRVLRLMCRLSLSPDSCVRQTEDIYERWGAPSLIFAKFVPGFAAVATSMAGVVRTRLPSFLFFDAIGALLWSGAAVTLGWIFRDAVDQVIEVLERAGRWGLIAIIAALAFYVAVKALQRYRLIHTLRMSRVSVEALRDMIARGDQPLIVDVRSSASQAKGRIPGAVQIDSREVEKSIRQLDLEDRAGEEVIVYCACPNEATAAAVAKKLMRAGFKRVRPLSGGYELWVDRGFEIERASIVGSSGD